MAVGARLARHSGATRRNHNGGDNGNASTQSPTQPVKSSISSSYTKSCLACPPAAEGYRPKTTRSLPCSFAPSVFRTLAALRCAKCISRTLRCLTHLHPGSRRPRGGRLSPRPKTVSSECQAPASRKTEAKRRLSRLCQSHSNQPTPPELPGNPTPKQSKEG